MSRDDDPRWDETGYGGVARDRPRPAEPEALHPAGPDPDAPVLGPRSLFTTLLVLALIPTCVCIVLGAAGGAFGGLILSGVLAAVRQWFSEA